MGCAYGRGEHRVPAHRRRLSLGEIEPGTVDDEQQSVSEEDRSFLVQLSQAQTLDLLNGEKQGQRKYSIGSETDKQMNRVNSFHSKSIKLQGGTFDTATEGIGFACKKGLKPESPNQDSFFIMKVEGSYSLYGVFDGHGKKGHDVSNFVKDNLPKILLTQDCLPDRPEEALTNTFAKTQHLIEKATQMKTIDASRSGTTCSVVLHKPAEDMVYVAHVGDSRVVLGRVGPREGSVEGYESVDLTVDHKPDLPAERARIENAGGVVLFDGGWNYRVYAKGKKDSRGKRYPGLNMSRAMGDLGGFHDAGISAVPDVNTRCVAVQPPGIPNTPVAIDPPEAGSDISIRPSEAELGSSPSVYGFSLDPSTDRFVLLCSDGVWEFISSQEAVTTVSEYSRDNAMAAAERLASMAWERWMRELNGQIVDDITAVVVYLV